MVSGPHVLLIAKYKWNVERPAVQRREPILRDPEVFYAGGLHPIFHPVEESVFRSDRLRGRAWRCMARIASGHGEISHRLVVDPSGELKFRIVMLDLRDVCGGSLHVEILTSSHGRMKRHGNDLPLMRY